MRTLGEFYQVSTLAFIELAGRHDADGMDKVGMSACQVIELVASLNGVSPHPDQIKRLPPETLLPDHMYVGFFTGVVERHTSIRFSE